MQAVMVVLLMLVLGSAQITQDKGTFLETRLSTYHLR